MADKEELFDLVDEEDNVIGTELRSIVHSKGLLHRAVYVWVCRPDGALLVQRRSPHKKIGPGQLDLSVAEHLQPGESYLMGAVRGLAEELGISVEAVQLSGPLAPTHRRELHQGAFHDVELVQSFRLDGYTGAVQIDEEEVVEARWVQLPQLRAHAEAHPEQYTQWFLDEVRSLQWFGAQAAERDDATQAAVAAAAAAAASEQQAGQQAGELQAKQRQQDGQLVGAAV